MASTLLLDPATWDLVLDANGNMAVASEPYSLAQDAASAIKTFLGECYLDTTVGVPWMQQVLGLLAIPTQQLKQLMVNAALTVPDVASATVSISAITQRMVSGQVQVVSLSGKTSAPVPFTAISPQGSG